MDRNLHNLTCFDLYAVSVMLGDYVTRDTSNHSNTILYAMHCIEKNVAD